MWQTVRPLWVGFDRPSVREQWPLKSIELTFVIKRLLWNALLSFVHCSSAALVGQFPPQVIGSFLASRLAFHAQGIPPGERERVFDRFYRRAAGGEEGTGLGLTIVKSVAARHAAAVTLGDSPLGGLRVTGTFTG